MKIIILSTYVQKWSNIDALRKEALLLYNLSRQEKPWAKIELVTIENDLCQCSHTDGVITTSMDDLNKCIDQLNPDIIHIVEATPYLLCKLLEHRQYPPCKIVVTCADNNPLMGLDKRMIEEIAHISDHNECFLFCYSEYALQTLGKAGIRNASIIPPLIDTGFFEIYSKTDIRNGRLSNNNYIVGFASTPCTEDSVAARGIDLLEKVMSKTNATVEFMIPWREPSVDPPSQFLSDDRVHLSYGPVDMAAFYNNIDIYMLPFAGYGHNHASPHSFWEAIVYGKPVIVTDRVGVASLVERYGIGIVCGPEEKELAEAIQKIIDDYQIYYDQLNSLKHEILCSLLDQQTIINKYFHTYQKLLSDASKVLTLSSWRNSLTSNGKELIKGINPLKNYYTAQSETITYREKRFEHFPMNVYNQMELQAVQSVLDKHSSGLSNQMELLDIAAGDGRITETLYDHGYITIIENSSNMIQIIMDTLKANLEENFVTMIKADFLDMDLDNFNNHFDIATTFRFIRHFEYDYRRYIYSKVSKILKHNGLLIFDVPNKYTEIMLRNKLGWDNFNIYDVFWTKESIENELQLNGFELKSLISVGQYCFRNILDFAFTLPMSWVAVAKKIGN